MKILVSFGEVSAAMAPRTLGRFGVRGLGVRLHSVYGMTGEMYQSNVPQPLVKIGTTLNAKSRNPKRSAQS